MKKKSLRMLMRRMLFRFGRSPARMIQYVTQSVISLLLLFALILGFLYFLSKNAFAATPALPNKNLEIILNKHFPDSFSVTKVQDIFPVELSLSEKKLPRAQQLELRSYYAYARNELAKISGGQFLPAVFQDFDLDGKKDYAALVTNKSTGSVSLMIVNEAKVLYQAEFPHHYTELMSHGAYPLSVIVGKEMKKVNSPCLRLISIAGPHEFLFFDRAKHDWVRMKANDGH